jgi:hypothetical protein
MFDAADIKDLKDKIEGRMYMYSEGYFPNGPEPREVTQGRIRELAFVNNLLADLLKAGSR